MSTPAVGGFSPARLDSILQRCCAAAGLDPTVGEVLPSQTNAVIKLANVPVVVKIPRAGVDPDEAALTVQVVRWLTGLAFPTAQLFPVAQPVLVDGHAITFWSYLPQPDRDIRVRDVATPLRLLHKLPIPTGIPLRRHDPVTAIRNTLSAATCLPPHAAALLNSRLDQASSALKEACFALPESVIHGDPQHRNTIYDDDRTLLCDWDTVALGRPEWDLTTIEVHCRRFGRSRAGYTAFAEAYGFDVAAWPGYPAMRDLRELQILATNAANIAQAPLTLTEIMRRVNGLASNDIDMPWQTFMPTKRTPQ